MASPRVTRSRSVGPKQGAPAPTRRSQRLIEKSLAEKDDRTKRCASEMMPDTSPPANGGAAAAPPMRRAAAGRRVAARAPKRQRRDHLLTGLFESLPLEILDDIIERCGPRELSALETTCTYFKVTRKLDNICFNRLQSIPRAKGLEPNRGAFENWASILFFITSQSNAAAQATALALGNTHSAALLVDADGSDGDHNLYTFGRGFHGELGQCDFEDSDEPAHLCIGYQPCSEHPDMEEEITPAVVTCGNSHTVCITRRGMMYSFGLGNRGELGHGTRCSEVWFPERCYLMDKPHLRIVSIACGSNHTLAISEIGTLWACGQNNKGQLGIGNMLDSCQLRPLSGALRSYRVVAAAAGQNHSMALSSDGSLFTWGSGSYGQLGHPQLHALHLMQANHAFIVDTPRKLDVLDPFKLQPWKRVTAISSGKNHCMAVTVCGEIMAFGRNKSGELGLGHTRSIWVPTLVNMSWSGAPSTCFRTSQVACGADHTLALVMYRGRLTPCATGACTFGQLGQGDQVKRSYFTPINSLASEEVVTLQAGDHNSGAICANGNVYLWGRNDHGQLGMGDNRSRWFPTLLNGYIAVHPDRTLRKNKRSLPRMRPIVQEGDAAPSDADRLADAVKAAFFFGTCKPQGDQPADAARDGAGTAGAAPESGVTKGAAEAAEGGVATEKAEGGKADTSPANGPAAS